MRNQKVTLMHEPHKGVHLFVHKPTRMEFAVVGNHPEAYLKDCVAFPDREDCDEIHHPNHLTVLEDFKVITRYNFREFVFHPICPGRMQHLLDFIESCPNLEKPDIVVTHDFFNHIYGINQEKKPEDKTLTIEKDSGYVFAIHEESGIKIAANAAYFNSPKANTFDKFKLLDVESLTVEKDAFIAFPAGCDDGIHLFYTEKVADIAWVGGLLGQVIFN